MSNRGGIICSIFTVALVVLFVLLGLSLQSLEYNEVGLNYSSYFKSIENYTYDAGWQFLGLGHVLKPFPQTLQTLEFSNANYKADLPAIVARTKDGLSIVLEISFQYRIQRDKIYEIYMTYGEDYKTQILRVSIDSISDTATLFSALSFFTDKVVVSKHMQENLDKALDHTVFVNVKFFQLRSIDLPDKYELAIQETEVTKQDIYKALAERQRRLTVQKMNVDLAEIRAESTINEAEG